jgi:hypothetical protein
LAGAGCALLAGCGGDGDPGLEYALGVPMRQASCAEWEKAGPREREHALEELRAIRNDQISGRGAGRGYGSVLKDDVAYRLFESRCRLPSSESFLLYKMYSFAAGFVGEAPAKQR